MNKFFSRKPFDFEMPRRLHALQIDDDYLNYVLYDAVDAVWLMQRLAERDGLMNFFVRWPEYVEKAPVYAVELNARLRPAARRLIRRLQLPRSPQWVTIDLVADENGEANVYASSVGPARRARIRVTPMPWQLQRILGAATDLTRYDRTSEVAAALPSATVHHVVVLDVGQGFASALIDGCGRIVGYVDLGAGVLADTRTWPTSMTGMCLSQSPVVILSHWHYDHFEAANIYPAARSLTWIAPSQTIGPGPQSAMASALASTGKLLVWRGPTASNGALTIERCTGSARDLNRTGIAVWVAAPSAAEDPILLPGDAGYKDVPGLLHGRGVVSLAAAHHVGKSTGKPPRNPGSAISRVAMSYGHANSYGHPLGVSISRLTAAGWSLGPAPSLSLSAKLADERRTEVRRGPGGTSIGGAGLGHVGLRWHGSNAYSRSCACGCSIDPTQ